MWGSAEMDSDCAAAPQVVRHVQDALRACSIDVDGAVLADLFEDDRMQLFGIVVLKDRRAFTFDYDYPDGIDLPGMVVRITEITGEPGYGPYGDAVRRALSLLESAT